MKRRRRINNGHRRSILALLFMLLIAVGLNAQSLDSLLDRGSFSSTEREGIVQVFAAASEAGIPEELLKPRLAEGIAKRVPAARILATLRLAITQLLEAKSLFLEVEAGELLADNAVWARAANLLSAGLSEPTVMGLASAAKSRKETFRPASTLLVSLIDWGLDEAAATALAAAAATSDLRTSEYPVVLDLLIQGRIYRVEIDDMVEQLLEVLPEATSARNLRRSIGW